MKYCKLQKNMNEKKKTTQTFRKITLYERATLSLVIILKNKLKPSDNKLKLAC